MRVSTSTAYFGGPLTQQASVLGFYPRCSGFESRAAHQKGRSRGATGCTPVL